MIDQKSPHQQYQLPAAENTLAFDNPRLVSTILQIDSEMFAVTNTADAAKLLADTINADIVSAAAANKILRLDGNGRLPASITGNAATATALATVRAIAISGDATGTANFNGTADANIGLTLANTGVAAGSYRMVTVDTKGRVTAGSNPTTLAGFGITDAYTKTEIDNIVSGLDPKPSVRVATTGPITLAGAQTIDGVAVVAGDRVLVKDQTAGAANGIYVVAAGAWARAADADASAEVTPGLYVWVEQGTTNADSGWVLTTDGTITLGTTALTFVQFNGLGQITTGTGLQKAGQTIKLADTTVAAGNYGSGTAVPTFTVDSQGRLTAAGSVTVTPDFANITNKPTTIGGYGITDAQPLDSDLTAVAALATMGLIARTAAGAAATRSIVAGTGMTVANGDAVAGNPTVTLANTSVAAASYGSATQAATFTVDAQGRLTAAGNVTVTPAWASITGKPTTLSGYGITDAQAQSTLLTAVAALATNGIVVKTAAGTSATRTITAGTGVSVSNGDGVAANPTVALANTSVVAGTYGAGASVPVFDVNAQGQITNVSNVAIAAAWANVTGKPSTLGGYGITDAATATHTHTLSIGDGTIAKISVGTNERIDLVAGANVAMQWDDALNKITISTSGQLSGNVDTASRLQTSRTIALSGDATGQIDFDGSANVTLPVVVLDDSHNHTFANLLSKPTTLSGYGITDAYTKVEVDNIISGLDPKPSVRVATTANIALTGTQTIDGVALAAGNRVLVKDQTTPSQNGIYVVAAGAWSRALDADANVEVTPGLYVWVEEGTTNADSGWVLTTDGAITIGTTGLTFVQFNGLGQVVAGTGLQKAGNTLNLANTAVGAGAYGSATQAATFTVDAQGRLTAAGSVTVTPAWASITGKPTTIAGYGINDAQPLSAELTADAGLAATGLIARTAAGARAARTITAGTGISVTNGDGVSANPAIALANTTVTPAAYGSATQVATFTVDQQGRLTAAANVAITPAWSSITGKPTTIAGYGITDAQALNANLTAVSGVAANGLYARTGATTAAARTITAGTGISVANGDGATGNPTITLVDTAVVVGSYGSTTQVGTFTVDQQGRITAAGNVTVTPAWNSISGKPNTVGGYNITDVYTKTEVDNIISGLDPKPSVKAATTANLAALSGAQTIDGVALVAGDRVLVKDQTTGSQNGIYVVAAGAWARAADANVSAEVTPGLYVWVEQGTVNADSGWVLVTDGTITLDTTALSFVQFNGLGQVTAGTGLQKAGNTLNLANTAVVAGTYGNSNGVPSFTVDAQGRITGVTVVTLTPSWANIQSKPTTLGGFGIMDAQPLSNELTADAAIATTGLLARTAAGTRTTRTIAGGTGISVTNGDGVAANPSIALANTAVAAAAYGSATQVGTFTVDAQGRLTAAANVTVTPAWGSITGKPTTLSGYGITDAQPLSNELTADAALAATGLISRTAAGARAVRTITAGTGMSVTNGDGVAGNPAVALANTAVTAGSYGSATSVAAITVDAQGRLTAAQGITITPAWASITGKPTTLAGYGIADALAAGTKDASGGVAGLTGYNVNVKTADGSITSQIASAATAARTWTGPDKSGTLALLSDIPVVIPATGSSKPAPGASDIVLTAANVGAVVLNPTQGVNVILPDATTMGANRLFIIKNTSAFALTLLDSARSGVTTIPPAATRFLWCSDNTTAAGEWTSDSSPSYMMTTGTAVTAATTSNFRAVALDANRALLMWDGASGAGASCVVYDYSTQTLGNEVQYVPSPVAGKFYGNGYAALISAGTIAISYTDQTDVFAVALLISGTTLTAGGAAQRYIQDHCTGFSYVAKLRDGEFAVVAKNVSSGVGYIGHFTVAGQVVTYVRSYTWDASGSDTWALAYTAVVPLATGVVAIVYANMTNSSTMVYTFEITSAAITQRSNQGFGYAANGQYVGAVKLADGKLAIGGTDAGLRVYNYTANGTYTGVVAGVGYTGTANDNMSKACALDANTIIAVVNGYQVRRYAVAANDTITLAETITTAIDSSGGNSVTSIAAMSNSRMVVTQSQKPRTAAFLLKGFGK